MIILDACRFEEFQQANNFDGKLEKRRALGAVTYQVIKRNFHGINAHDVLYLSDNSMVGRVHEDGGLDVYKFIGMWDDKVQRQGKGHENLKAVAKPEPVVDRALKLHDEYPTNAILSIYCRPIHLIS